MDLNESSGAMVNGDTGGKAVVNGVTPVKEKPADSGKGKGKANGTQAEGGMISPESLEAT